MPICVSTFLSVVVVGSSASRTSPAVIDSLFAWCAEHGARGLENLRIARCGSGLGVIAARDIAPGEEVLRLPLRLVLADRLLPGIDGQAPPPGPWRGAPWQAALAARLAVEQLDASDWQPWMRTLPRGLQGLALSGAPELQYTPAVAEVKALHADRAALAARTAAALTETLGPERAPSSTRVERALTLANTRAFMLELVEGDPWACCHAFVPLMDLFNHAPLADSHVEWLVEAGGADAAAGDGAGGLGGGADDGSGWLRVTARAAASAGEQLTLTYDPTATNDDYAVYHGFVPSSNPMDDVEIFGSVEEAIKWHRASFAGTPNAELAASALYLAALPPALIDGALYTRRVGVASAGPKGSPIWIQSDGADPRVLATFRLLAAEVAHEDGVAEEEECEEGGGRNPSTHAARALLRRCEEVLKAFPTTLEDDLTALAARGIRASDVNGAVAAAAGLGGEQGSGTAVGASGEAGVVSEALVTDEAQADARRSAPENEEAFVVALRYRAGKKLVLRAAMDWVRRRWLV
jgi:hypothetical protein